MYHIHRKTADISGQKSGLLYSSQSHKYTGSIHEKSINDQCRQSSVDTQPQCEMYPFSPFSSKDQSCQKSDDAKRKHLPGSPWPLPEEKVGNKSCQGACEESCFCPQTDSGNNHNSRCRFKLRQHNERCPACYSKSCHNGDYYHLPGL